MEGLVDYSRQAEFDGLFNGQRHLNNHIHVIIGCGGVGFWLGLILAMQGYDKFVLVDGQHVEPSNLNRLPVPPTWRGTKKTLALRKIMRQLRPLSTILTFSQHVSKENLNMVGELITRQRGQYMIWDCTDDARIQRMIFKWSKQVSFKYRKIGYEAFKVGTYVNYDVWTEPDYQPGYRTSNACAATSALAAVVGLMAEGLDVGEDININMRDILTHEVVGPDQEGDDESEEEE